MPGGILQPYRYEPSSLHYFESQTRYPLYIGFESRQDRLETQSFGALIFLSASVSSALG